MSHNVARALRPNPSVLGFCICRIDRAIRQPTHPLPMVVPRPGRRPLPPRRCIPIGPPAPPSDAAAAARRRKGNSYRAAACFSLVLAAASFAVLLRMAQPPSAKGGIEAKRWLRRSGSIGGGAGTGEGQERLPSAGQGAKTDADDGDWGGPAAAIGGGGGDGEPDCDLSTEECIRSLIWSHPVVVFAKPWCPHCRRALEALALGGMVDPKVIDLSALGGEDYRRVQDVLEGVTGRRTVPNVFVGGSSIGGGDETTYLQSQGSLQALVGTAMRKFQLTERQQR